MPGRERGARSVGTPTLALALFLIAESSKANPAPAPAPSPAPTPAPAPAPAADRADRTAASQPDTPEPVPNWSIRVGLSVGGPVLSDQEELLDLEGYSGIRWNTSLSVARTLSDIVGVGGLVLYGWRTAKAESEDEFENLTGVAPSYEESLVALGAQVPLSFGIGSKRETVFFVTPWAGVGFAKAEFESGGNWQTGPAFGASSGMFFPKVYLGFAAGAYFVPLPPPGEAGGHNDLGMIHLSFIGGADVG